MRIPVLGMDPSFTHWGLAKAELDLKTGILSTPSLQIIETEPNKCKQVRKSSTDVQRAQKLAETVIKEAKLAKAIFVEVPHGSQSANAMKSYGVCVGILGSLKGMNIELIEVNAEEVKHALTNKNTASKKEMIAKAIELYPEANFPVYRGKVTLDAEHVADAIGAIHAGVNTPLFRNILKLYG